MSFNPLMVCSGTSLTAPQPGQRYAKGVSDCCSTAARSPAPRRASRSGLLALWFAAFVPPGASHAMAGSEAAASSVPVRNLCNLMHLLPSQTACAPSLLSPLSFRWQLQALASHVRELRLHPDTRHGVHDAHPVQIDVRSRHGAELCMIVRVDRRRHDVQNTLLEGSTCCLPSRRPFHAASARSCSLVATFLASGHPSSSRTAVPVPVRSCLSPERYMMFRKKMVYCCSRSR